MINDIGLLLLRLVFGGTMLFSHGIPKLLDFSSKMNVFPDPLGIGNSLSLGLAIGSEVVCAFLIVIGLFTRWVSAPLIITMGVAMILVHGNHPWAKKEMAFLYLCSYAIIALLGPGRLSIDSFWRKKA
jgi:putative oxidoreductase